MRSSVLEGKKHHSQSTSSFKSSKYVYNPEMLDKSSYKLCILKDDIPKKGLNNVNIEGLKKILRKEKIIKAYGYIKYIKIFKIHVYL